MLFLMTRLLVKDLAGINLVSKEATSSHVCQAAMPG